MPSDNKFMLFGLSSGKQIAATEIMLFPEAEIVKIMQLKSRAQEELGGFSSGVGFWGSPEWALGGALALGFVESLISNSKMKKGMEILKDAAAKQVKLRELGSFITISDINGIHRPTPSEWNANKAGVIENTRVNLDAMTSHDRNETIKKFNLGPEYNRGDVSVAIIPTQLPPTPYIYDGNDFITVKSEGKTISLRLALIESYELISL